MTIQIGDIYNHQHKESSMRKSSATLCQASTAFTKEPKTAPPTTVDDCYQDTYPNSRTPPDEKDDFYDRFCSESFHAVVISEDGFEILEEKGLIS